jgi:hypothetical protein
LEITIGIGFEGISANFKLAKVGQPILVGISLAVAREIRVQGVLQLVSVGQSITVTVAWISDENRYCVRSRNLARLLVGYRDGHDPQTHCLN